MMRFLPTMLALFLVPPLLGQGTPEDFKRSAELPKLTNGTVFQTNVRPNWFANGDRFWYRNELAGRKHDYVLVDAVQGKREAAFDHAKLAQALGKDVSPDALPLTALSFSADARTAHFRALDKSWAWDRETHTLTEAELPKIEQPPSTERARPESTNSRPRSPDGQFEVRTKNGNLVLRDTKTGEEFELTRDAQPDDGYDSRVWWSPDAKKLVALRTKRPPTRQVSLIESSPRTQIQPLVVTYPYAKPGDPLPIAKPHLFDIETRKEISISEELFPNPWSIDRLRWDEDSKRFTFLYNQRGHQVMRWLAVDADSGKVTPIINEECRTFFDYSGKLYLHRLAGGREVVWMSERDGWNHLYLIDAATGEVKNPITRGEWVVRRVERIDESTREVWFWAGGIRPEQDPYYLHYCRVNLDGSNLTILTEGDGTHSITPSPDGRFFLDTYSRVDLAPITELRSSKEGQFLCRLEQANVSRLLATGWRWPERFVAKGRDGTTDIYGVIFRPTNFDPAKKYPVIEDIYAGPHDSHVPKAFRALHYNAQVIAELGFIVVRIDGMGTSNRSKAFHDVCWKNLGDAGFPDRIAWMKAASAKYPEMDLSRVGIYGGSAGGQNAMRALLAHGDFYHVAVADCGCHDNRMDKVWWNELWMSYPIGPHYAESSNVAQAHRLTGKLLLIVGEVDRNVDPASTMQVVNALIKADKDFDLLVMPGVGHGAAETPYGQRRRKEFFVRHLLKQSP